MSSFEDFMSSYDEPGILTTIQNNASWIMIEASRLEEAASDPDSTVNDIDYHIYKIKKYLKTIEEALS